MEGKDRPQRAFFEQLASDVGFILDWQLLDADRMIAAAPRMSALGSGGTRESDDRDVSRVA